MKKIDDKKIIRDKLNSDLDYNKFLFNEFDELIISSLIFIFDFIKIFLASL